jgi:hypothetical protein
MNRCTFREEKKIEMKAKMRRVAAVFAVMALLAGCASHQPEQKPVGSNGPQDVVTAYMNALKSQDYAEAMRISGVNFPQPYGNELNRLLKPNQQFSWTVNAFQIKDATVNGGLATVTVEENSTIQASPTVKQRLGLLGVDASKFQWGERTVQEKLVLVNLNNAWVFDPVHSGLPLAGLPMDQILQSVRERQPLPLTAQATIAAGLDNVGMAQVMQTVATVGPLVPAAVAFETPQMRAEAP